MARFSAPLPTLTLASLALLLSACGSGQSNTAGQVSETSVTSPAATSSAPVSSSAAPSAQATESSAPASSAPVALPTLASGKTVEFTPEELAAYQRGEYVPASERHPAYNVPVPVMPEVAKAQTAEGAKAFAEYWRDCINYAFATGNSRYFIESSEKEQLAGFYMSIDRVVELYKINDWVAGTQVVLNPYENHNLQNGENEYDLIVSYGLTGGAIYSSPDVVKEHVEDDGVADLMLTVVWREGQWVAYEMKGVS